MKEPARRGGRGAQGSWNGEESGAAVFQSQSYLGIIVNAGPLTSFSSTCCLATAGQATANPGRAVFLSKKSTGRGSPRGDALLKKTRLTRDTQPKQPWNHICGEEQ